jgi:hypothetical protein
LNFDIATAILLLVGIIGVSVTQELVKIFFARMRTSDYVTKQDCERCKTGAKDADIDAAKKVQATAEKVDAIARLVLAMAIKMGIDTKDIQKLM